MTSAIDPTKPTTVNPRFSDVRNNFDVTKTEIEDLQENKQDKLTAGTNITIVGNVISSAGGSGGVGGAVTIPYIFSTTTTDSDPGDGLLRLNNATQNAATIIRADLLSSNTTDWGAVLATLADSTNAVKGLIRLFLTADPTKWLLFTVSALASPSGYKNITVACVGYSSASPFADADEITMTFERAGDQGATGPNTIVINALGTKSTTQTVTLDYTLGNVHTVTCSGTPTLTLAFSSWPGAGLKGFFELVGTNMGLATWVFPTIQWKKIDDTFTTTFSTYLTDRAGETALKTSGVDRFLFWSDDSGITVYGILI